MCRGHWKYSFSFHTSSQVRAVKENIIPEFGVLPDGRLSVVLIFDEDDLSTTSANRDEKVNGSTFNDGRTLETLTQVFGGRQVTPFAARVLNSVGPSGRVTRIKPTLSWSCGWHQTSDRFRFNDHGARGACRWSIMRSRWCRNKSA